MPTPTYPGATSWSLISTDLSTVNGTMSDFHFRFTSYKEGTWNLRIFDEYGQSSNMVLNLDFDFNFIGSGFHFNDWYEVNINQSINLVAGHKYTYVLTPIFDLPDFYYPNDIKIDNYLGIIGININTTSLDAYGYAQTARNIPSIISLSEYNYNCIFSIDMTGLVAINNKFSDANLIVGNDIYANFTDGNDYFDASLYYYLRNTLSNESAGNGDDFVNVGITFGGNFSGGLGNDIIRYDGTYAGVSIYGDGGDDVIYSGGGYADGGAGNDIIVADSNSWISGGGGEDILYSGTWSYNEIELWGGEVVWNVDYTDILQIHGSGVALSDRNPDGSYTVNWSGGSATLHTLHPIALELHPDQSNPDWSEVGIMISATKQFTFSSDLIDFNVISYDDMFLNSDSRYRFNSLDGDDKITLPGDDAGLESWGMLHVLFSAGKGNDTVIGGNGSDTISGDDGDDLIHGNGGDDVIIAGSGNDFVSGDEGNDRFILTTEDLPNAGAPSPLDIFDGGNGEDLLKLSGLTGTQGTIAYLIDSAGAALTGLELATALGPGGNTLDMSTFVGNFVSVETIVGSAGRDTLIFSGGTQENNAGQPTYVMDGNRVDFGQSTFELRHLSASYPTDLPITMKGVERIIFADGINNTVDLSQSRGNVAYELLWLADQAYGPLTPFAHTAEALAYNSDPNAPQTPSSAVTDQATRGHHWHAVSALEFGMSMADGPADANPDLRYSFTDGLYQAFNTTESLSIGQSLSDMSEATAMVLTGLVPDSSGDMKRTLTIVFRGADQIADAADFQNFLTHYNKFQPLVDGIKDYLAHNQVDQVLISGHSMGGALAEYLAYDLKHWGDYPDLPVNVVTMGSPGSERLPYAVGDNISGVSEMNFFNSDDLIPDLGQFSQDYVTRAFATVIIDAMVTAGVLYSNISKIGGALKNFDEMLAALHGVGSLSTRGNLILAKSLYDLYNFYENGWSDIRDTIVSVHDFLQSFEPKYIHGSQISISNGEGIHNPFHAGSADQYLADMGKILDFAQDDTSPFYASGLAQALRANSIYDAGLLHINVGDGSDTNWIGDHDDFVLGNGLDETFHLDQSDAASVPIIDGAGGIDRLFIHDTSSSYDWSGLTSNGGWNIVKQSGSPTAAHNFAIAFHVERLMFFDMMVSSDGSQLKIDRPNFVVTPLMVRASQFAYAPLATNVFTLSTGFDYADAGDGDMSVFGTTGADVIYYGIGAKDIHGNDGADFIIGKSGSIADFVLIDGGAGGDTMIGGNGNETYVVDNIADRVIERVQGGNDKILTSLSSYVLESNVENLEHFGSGNFVGGGNELDNQLIGGAGIDVLYGYDSNDTLDGGSGADVLVGGIGDDRYLIDTQADLIFEAADEGTDSAVTTASFYLYANVENLTLASGAGDLFGVSNELANTLTGNEGSNLLIAGAGDDLVNGGAGVDSLFGEDGADTLNGEAGIDYLVGGIGNDTLNGGGDADALYGEDGDDTLNGGSSFHTDILVGGAGNDVLDARSGQANPDYDLIDGGDGNDTYYVDTGADLTFEAANGGTDTVYADVTVVNAGVYLYANVENLVLLGTTAFGVGNGLDNVLTGSASGNWLLGGLGSDMINGKEGNDVLFGEGGADTFVFDSGTGKDVIGDFQAGTDKINLIGYALTFAQLQTLFVQVGNVGAIQMLNGDVIVLHNVTMASLSASDFVFG